MHCPTNEQLLELLSVTAVSGESLCSVQEHVRVCSSCQAALSKLSDCEELTEYQRLALSTVRDLKQEDACQKLVEEFASRPLWQVAVTSTSMAASPGEIRELGPYRLISELGRGGMAVVYDAVDTRLNRRVALKVLNRDVSDTRSRARFTREARALAGLHNSHVVSVFDVSEPDSPWPYFVMERVDGGTLQSSLQKKELDRREVVKIFQDTAEGLAAVHAAGLIHRDIKPSNILLAKPEPSSSDRFVAKLADFGLARDLERDALLTETAVLSGTPVYMSPEQVSASEQLSTATDIYSLGVSFYEALTGEIPFRGSPQAVMQQVVDGDFPSPRKLDRNIPHELELICLKATNREPRHRYESASAFAEDLHRWLTGQPILAKPTSRITKLWRWATRNPVAATQLGTIAGLLIFLAAGATLAAVLLNQARVAQTNEAESARVSRVAAEASAQNARRQGDLALQSLTKLVDAVERQLDRKSGTLKLREELLRTALDGLEKIAESDDLELRDRTSFQAKLQLARIYSSLGETQAAQEQVDRAVQHAEESLRTLPEDMNLLRDLADAFNTKSSFYMASFNWNQAEPLVQRVVALREQLFSANQQSDTDFRAYLSARQTLADLSNRRNHPAEAERLIRENIALFSQRVDLDSSERGMIRDYTISCNRLATLLLSQQKLSEAAEYCERSMGLTKRLVEAEPDSRIYRSDLAFIHSLLARTQAAQRAFPEALSNADAALLEYRKLAQESPDDVSSQTIVGSASHLKYTILSSMGLWKDAIESAKVGVEIQVALMEKFPDAIKYIVLAAEGMISIAEIHVRTGNLEQAIDEYKMVGKIAERSQKAIDFSPNHPFHAMIRDVAVYEKAYRLALRGEGELIRQVHADNDCDRLALVVRNYLDFYQGKTESALRQLKEMGVPDFDDAGLRANYYLFAIRGCALGGRKNPDRQDDVSQRLQEECAAHAESLVEELLAIAPNLRSFLASDFDMQPLMDRERFRKLLLSAAP